MGSESPSTKTGQNFWLLIIVIFLLLVLGTQDSLLKNVSFGGNKTTSTPVPEPALQTYSNNKFNFSFRYPETLKLSRENNEEQLRSLPVERKPGETMPYGEIYLEEANPPSYQPQSRAGATAVLDIYVDGYEVRKITCGDKILSTVAIDPRNENRYFKITGHLSTEDSSRKELFRQTDEKIIAFFRFSAPREEWLDQT